MGTKKLRSNAYEAFSGQKQGDAPMLACAQKKKNYLTQGVSMRA